MSIYTDPNKIGSATVMYSYSYLDKLKKHIQKCTRIIKEISVSWKNSSWCKLAWRTIKLIFWNKKKVTNFLQNSMIMYVTQKADLPQSKSWYFSPFQGTLHNFCVCNFISFFFKSSTKLYNFKTLNDLDQSCLSGKS